MRTKVEMARTTYFAYSALILFLASAVQVVWLQSIPAATGGYLWVLMVISLAASIASGYFVCCIAMARSRDAYGTARRAFLAFIPIANFWLLFTRSKDEASTNRASTIPLFSAALGVLTGFVLLSATVGVTVYIKEQLRLIEQRVETEPASIVIESMIRSNGLEETLRLMVRVSNADRRGRSDGARTDRGCWKAVAANLSCRSRRDDDHGEIPDS